MTKSWREDPNKEFGGSLRLFFKCVPERMEELPAMGISYEPGIYEKKVLLTTDSNEGFE